jgi:hypothetical protein
VDGLQHLDDAPRRTAVEVVDVQHDPVDPRQIRARGLFIGRRRGGCGPLGRGLSARQQPSEPRT